MIKKHTAVMTNGEIATRNSKTHTYAYCVQVTDIAIDDAIRGNVAAKTRTNSAEWAAKYDARIAELEARKAAGAQFATDKIYVEGWCSRYDLAVKLFNRLNGLNGRVATILEVQTN